MSWSYSGDPSTTDLDEYRFAIGDTIEDMPMMQNEEIQYIIDTYPNNKNMIMYQLFLRAAALFARDIKRSLGPQSEDPTERLKFFSAQTEYYRKKISATGLSMPNYSHPQIFHIGMNNNPPYKSGKGANDV